MMTKLNLLLWLEKSDNYAYLCYLKLTERRELINDLVVSCIMQPELMNVLNLITESTSIVPLPLIKQKLLTMLNEREMFVYQQLCRLN